MESSFWGDERQEGTRTVVLHSQSRFVVNQLLAATEKLGDLGTKIAHISSLTFTGESSNLAVVGSLKYNYKNENLGMNKNFMEMISPRGT